MKNSVPSENCLTEDQILRYLRDECWADEVRLIDRHLAQCPLCSDALEGALLLTPPQYSEALDSLNQKIDTHLEIKSAKPIAVETEKTVLTVVKKSSWRMAWIAAASVAAIVSAGIWLLTQPAQFAENEQVASQVKPPLYAPADSTIPTLSDEIAASGIAKKQILTDEEKVIADAKTDAAPLDDRVVASETASPPINLSQTNTSNDTIPAAKPATRTTVLIESDKIVTEGGQKMDSDKDADKDVGNQKEVVAMSETNRPKAKHETTRSADAKSQNVPTMNNYPGAGLQNSIPSSPNIQQIGEAKASAQKKSADAALANYQEAMRFYKKEDYAKAISLFNRVFAAQRTGEVYENALWYAANAYLKLGKKAEANGLLKRILAEGGRYAKEAAALLKE